MLQEDGKMMKKQKLLFRLVIPTMLILFLLPPLPFCVDKLPAPAGDGRFTVLFSLFDLFLSRWISDCELFLLLSAVFGVLDKLPSSGPVNLLSMPPLFFRTLLSLFLSAFPVFSLKVPSNDSPTAVSIEF